MTIVSTVDIESVSQDNDGDYVCIHSDDNALTDTIVLDVYGKQ